MAFGIWQTANGANLFLVSTENVDETDVAALMPNAGCVETVLGFVHNVGDIDTSSQCFKTFIYCHSTVKPSFCVIKHKLLW